MSPFKYHYSFGNVQRLPNIFGHSRQCSEVFGKSSEILQEENLTHLTLKKIGGNYYTD